MAFYAKFRRTEVLKGFFFVTSLLRVKYLFSRHLGKLRFAGGFELLEVITGMVG